MTLNEAIGIKYGMYDVKTGGEVSLAERCRRAIEFLGGLDEVAKFIPFPVEILREKFKEDPNLDNTSLSTWDKAAGFRCGTWRNAGRQKYQCLLVRGGIWELYEKHGITSASCDNGVCLLKEAARMLVERERSNSKMEVKKMRLPTCEEWDRLADVADESDSIMHWKDMFSWCQNLDNDPDWPSFRVIRGIGSARYRTSSYDMYRSAYAGFRPTFEADGIEDMCDGAVITIGTLYMNGRPVKVPVNPVMGGDITRYLPGAKLEFQAAIDNPAYQVKAIKAGNVLIADRVLLNYISWRDITETSEPAESIATCKSSMLEALLAENAKNLEDPSDTYAQGYHDAIVDVMHKLDFPTEETYFD